MPLVFLLLIALSTGVLAAHAGREEVRHSADPMWRMEAFLAYALFVALVLLPTTIYFYVFHGDWFLLYWVDAAKAAWAWGILVSAALLGFSMLGFRLGAALCRAGREAALRRIAALGFVAAAAVWPLAWARLHVVGSYREFTRDYGLTTYFSSAAFYAGLVMLILLVAAFVWVAYRIDSHTHEPT
ncbi:MAG: hypothetical protein AAF500_20315 [Myxococcota bacterium]